MPPHASTRRAPSCAASSALRPPRASRQVSSSVAITASRAFTRAWCSASPRARASVSIGSAWSITCGKPARAWPRAPPTPCSMHARSPLWPVAAGAPGSAMRASRPARAAMVPASRSIDAAAAVTSRPRAQIAPRCVLTPPLAAIIAASPSRPMAPMRRRSMASSSAIRRPASAIWPNAGRNAQADAHIRDQDRSRWAPAPRRSTRPGFGVSIASSISAATAWSANANARSGAASAGIRMGSRAVITSS